MKILSLFDGMACGMLAFKSANVPVERYVAFEIDKFAIKTAKHNFSEIEENGDVFKADFSEFSNFDFLIGGSPCTYWSIAQTANRETEASGIGWELFLQYVRALHEAKPKYFIYENNKSMNQQIRTSIDETFGFEAVCINSALVSAQNRQRLYWVGVRNSDGTYRRVEVEQPQDKGIVLKDVLDGITDRDKARTVMSSAGRTTTREYFSHSQGNMKFIPINTTVDDKAQTIRVTCYKDGNMVANNVDRRTCVAVPIRVGQIGNGSQGNRLYSIDGKSVVQTASGGGMGAKTGLYCIPAENGKGFEVKDGLITIKGKQFPVKLPNGAYDIRKLTVAECKRLQTVPDWYDFSCVSDTQAYKMLGNGWTVDVIKHLICSALELPTECQKAPQITIDDLI